MNTTIPTGCIISYDVLNAKTGETLLKDIKTSSIDISKLPNVELCLKIFLHVFGQKSPVIRDVQVLVKKRTDIFTNSRRARAI